MRQARRGGDWKLLSNGSDRIELYRIPNDTDESTNVARQYPEVTAKLVAQLADWRASLPQQAPDEFISKTRRAKNTEQ